jgi:hypothetical protein
MSGSLSRLEDHAMSAADPVSAEVIRGAMETAACEMAAHVGA